MKEKDILEVYKEVDKLLAQQDPKKALLIIDEVIKKLDTNQLWYKARGLFWKQLCYKQLGDINKAEKSGKEALSIYRKLGDKVQASNVLRDTASLYDHIGKFEKALEIINLSLKEIEDQKVLQTLGLSLAKKGRILSEIGDYYGAETSLLAAEQVIDSTDNLMHRLTVSTLLMELFVKIKRYSQASFYAKKSENLLEKLRDEVGYINEIRYSQIQLARSLIAQGRGKYKESIMRIRNFLKFGIKPKT